MSAMIEGHEQVLLAALMNGHDLSLDEADFVSPPNQLIFAAIQRLDKNRSLLAVQDELKRQHQFEAVGGHGLLNQIYVLPTDAANIAYALDEVLSASRQRREREIGGKLHVGAITSDEAQEQLQKLHGRNGKFTMRSPNEILALPRDQSANYLADRALAKGQSLLMAGIGDLGKSRLNLQQITALVIERPWCGLETHARGIKAVIFQAENINHRLQDDLEAVKRWAGKDWKLIDQNIEIHTLETDEDFIVALSDPAKVREMERIVRSEKPGFVSFDATYNFGIGDLNADQDMLATYRAMNKIARSGNPDCALTMLHHALTGREGMKKAYGFERSGFARNSKVIFQLSRAVINIAPGNEDYSVLLLFCAKNNNGKKFEDTAIRLNPETMIYEPEQDFDFEGWKEQIAANKTASRRKFTVDMVREANLRFTELEIKPLAQLIIDKLGCARARAYELVHECTTAKVFRHIKITDTYAKS
jgi:hypothetical protein